MKQIVILKQNEFQQEFDRQTIQSQQYLKPFSSEIQKNLKKMKKNCKHSQKYANHKLCNKKI